MSDQTQSPMGFEVFIRRRRQRRFANTGVPTIGFGKNGVVSFNQMAYRMLLEPVFVTIHLDRQRGLLGLSRAQRDDPDTYKVTCRQGGTAQIRSDELFAEFRDRYRQPLAAEA